MASSLNGTGITFSDGTSQSTAIPVVGTAVSTAGGATTVTFSGIPSWAKQVKVLFSGVQSSSSQNWLLQLGTSGGIETSGYASSYELESGAGTANPTNAFGIFNHPTGSSQLVSGAIELFLYGSNKWIEVGSLKMTNSTASGTHSIGEKTLSGTLSQIRLLNTLSDTYIAGSINIQYQ